ncbi:hypothetical protein FVE85_4893 [Porphyridium purpureum]|uniref:Uncharacterized protein n=1 Tax=Porphyridium purpureum TaxID=35688 RepID=A0A5J4YR40_PORPP|nr:hypothetical protein FVE85_4893 [Porphyridium purpureum]|eukprot:POR2309..scf236_6
MGVWAGDAPVGQGAIVSHATSSGPAHGRVETGAIVPCVSVRADELKHMQSTRAYAIAGSVALAAVATMAPTFLPFSVRLATVALAAGCILELPSQVLCILVGLCLMSSFDLSSILSRRWVIWLLGVLLGVVLGGLALFVLAFMIAVILFYIFTYACLAFFGAILGGCLNSSVPQVGTDTKSKGTDS